MFTEVDLEAPKIGDDELSEIAADAVFDRVEEVDPAQGWCAGDFDGAAS